MARLWGVARSPASRIREARSVACVPMHKSVERVADTAQSEIGSAPYSSRRQPWNLSSLAHDPNVNRIQRKEIQVEASEKPHASGKVPAGDTTQRVGIEAIEARGVDVDQLIEKLIDAAGAEFTTYYYYTILRMYLAGE